MLHTEQSKIRQEGNYKAKALYSFGLFLPLCSMPTSTKLLKTATQFLKSKYIVRHGTGQKFKHRLALLFYFIFVSIFAFGELSLDEKTELQAPKLDYGLTMILQDRDIDIFKFINKFAFVSTTHLVAMFGLTERRTYQILARLVTNSYLEKQRVITSEPSIYCLTKLSADLLQSKKPKPITLQNLKHNLLLVDVYISIKLESPELEVLSDRDLRKGKGFGYKGHIPDLLVKTIELNGKKDIAIELELTTKDKKRLKTILRRTERLDYLEVHYYCNSSTYNLLSKETKFISLFKVFNYFKDEHKPLKDVVAYIQEKDISKSKDLEILANKQKNEISLLNSRVSKKEKEIEVFKNRFDKFEFKKTTFGNNYSLTGEDFIIMQRIVKNL